MGDETITQTTRSGEIRDHQETIRQTGPPSNRNSDSICLPWQEVWSNLSGQRDGDSGAYRDAPRRLRVTVSVTAQACSLPDFFCCEERIEHSLLAKITAFRPSQRSAAQSSNPLMEINEEIGRACRQGLEPFWIVRNNDDAVAHDFDRSFPHQYIRTLPSSSRMTTT